MEQRELEAAIYGALDKLDPEKRMTVVMYEMEGRSLEEIAVMLTFCWYGKVTAVPRKKMLEKLLRRHLEKQESIM